MNFFNKQLNAVKIIQNVYTGFKNIKSVSETKARRKKKKKCI